LKKKVKAVTDFPISIFFKGIGHLMEVMGWNSIIFEITIVK